MSHERTALKPDMPLGPYIPLVEELTDPVCLVSLSGILEFMNAAFKQVVGYEAVKDLTNHGGLPKVFEGVARLADVSEAIKRNEPWEGQTRVYPKTGNYFTVCLRALPLVDAYQRVIGAAYFLKDVYVRKPQAEYLHLLEPFAENANDAVMITDAELLDEPGPRILYVNAAFTALTGYKPEEVLGKSPRFLQGPRTDRKELAKIREALEAKQATKIELINYRKDGQEFWVDFSLVPVANSTGKVTHFVSIQRDTTHKRSSQQALMESQSALKRALQANQDILDHTLDVVCAWDGEGRFVQVNQACVAIWGFLPEELIGQYNTDFIHPDDLKEGESAWKVLMEQRENFTFENRFIHKEGQSIFMMWRGTWSESNQLAYMIGRDITGVKAAEDRLKKSERLYRTLVDNFPNGAITILNRDYTIDFIGGQGLTQINQGAEFFTGKSIVALLEESLDQEIIEKIAPTFQGQPVSFELPFEGSSHACQTVPLSAQQIMIVSQDISARKKAEKELQNTFLAQQRLAAIQTAILDAIPAPLALVNAKGIIMAVNGAWKAFADQNQLQLPTYGVGEDYLRICDAAKGDNADEAPMAAMGIREVISGRRKAFSMEYPCHSPMERRWFKLIVTPMLKEYPSDVVVMHMSITERIEIELKLQESEQHYKSLFENHPDAICSMDMEGNFTSLNEILAAYIGKPAGALLNQPLLSFLPPENQKNFQDFFKLTSKGKPQNFEARISTWKVKPMAVNITNIPIKINGHIKGVFSIIKDITAKRRVQKLLVESAQRLNTMLDSITDGFFAVNNHFVITYWNKEAEKLLEVKRGEVLGKNLWEAFPIDIESKYYLEFHRALQENLPVHFEEYYTDKFFWTEVSAYPSKEGLSIYFKDISERKKAEENLLNYTMQLEKINSELDQFVYRTSHDLRSPLLSILGLIDIAQEEKNEAQKNEYLRLMDKSVRKLDNFILDIIHYSKNARTDITLSEINFDFLVREALDDLKYLDDSKTIAIHTQIEEVPGFYTDATRLKVVLNNIIANAIRYHDPTKEQQYIAIRIEKEAKDAVRITVEDNGQGIADKHQVRIFEMFYRANANHAGSGLGLYIVKESLKKMKGSIQLQSKIGEGTTFTIVLPNLAMNN